MNTWIAALIFVVASGASFITGGTIAWNDACDHWKKQAVARGHAEYVVNEDGLPAFKWKEPTP